MSRSYKKFAIVRQERENYNYLNRKIRRDKSKIPNGSAFKKHSPHWYSWAYIWPLEDAIKSYEKDICWKKKYPTLEEFLIWYKKAFLSK